MYEMLKKMISTSKWVHRNPHPFASQNPQQERGGALLFLCAPGEFWTRYSPAKIFLELIILRALMLVMGGFLPNNYLTKD